MKYHMVLVNTMMLRMILIMTVTGCSSFELRAYNRVTFITANIVTTCDVVSTIEMSDWGRWDRKIDGGALHEKNPILGATPSIALIMSAGITDISVNTIVYNANIPEWVKAIWFSTVTAAEIGAVMMNRRFVGICGIDRM